MQSNKPLDALSKNLNKDLKSLSQWLKAKKLSLNISKTELIIFHRNTASIDHSLKLKLHGERLSLSQSVSWSFIRPTPSMERPDCSVKN